MRDTHFRRDIDSFLGLAFACFKAQRQEMQEKKPILGSSLPDIRRVRVESNRCVLVGTDSMMTRLPISLLDRMAFDKPALEGKVQGIEESKTVTRLPQRLGLVTPATDLFPRAATGMAVEQSFRWPRQQSLRSNECLCLLLSSTERETALPRCWVLDKAGPCSSMPGPRERH